jgi:hypothetical protein
MSHFPLVPEVMPNPPIMWDSDCATFCPQKVGYRTSSAVDFEILQVDVSDLDDNVLFRSPAPT